METDPDIQDAFDYEEEAGDFHRGLFRRYVVEREDLPEPDIVAVSDTDDEHRSAIEYFSEDVFDETAEDANDAAGWVWVEAGDPYHDALYAGVDSEIRGCINTLIYKHDWQVTQTTERGEEWVDDMEEKPWY